MIDVLTIDPDLKESGVCFLVVDGKERRLECKRMSMPELVDFVRKEQPRKVIVEAGWLNKKSNFHGNNNTAKGERIARNVGENHAAGKLICEFLQWYGLRYDTIRPLPKMWRGKDGKITTEELNVQLRGKGFPPVKRCNQDERDAMLILLSTI